MTARQVFEGMLIELSKVNAPSMLLSEFNYYFNKAINLYINKRYNIYDVNQLTTDDIRVLKSTAVLKPTKAQYTSGEHEDTSYDASSYLSTKYSIISNLQGATYEVSLPDDYLHLLNCICVYRVNKNFKCYNAGSYVQFPAKRLTADSWATVINDFYNRPAPERPYFYIHNTNALQTPGNSNLTVADVPTNPRIFDEEGNLVQEGTDVFGMYMPYKAGDDQNNSQYDPDNEKAGLNEWDYSLADNIGSNFERVKAISNGVEGGANGYVSTVERATAVRYGNASKVRMEVRYGKDNSVFELVEVAVDYVKAPQHIRLTQEQLDLTEDTSQIMEFPDYVCQEIINELALLVMARTGDPVLNSFPLVTLSIANPSQAQQLAPTTTK